MVTWEPVSKRPKVLILPIPGAYPGGAEGAFGLLASLADLGPPPPLRKSWVRPWIMHWPRGRGPTVWSIMEHTFGSKLWLTDVTPFVSSVSFPAVVSALLPLTYSSFSLHVQACDSSNNELSRRAPPSVYTCGDIYELVWHGGTDALVDKYPEADCFALCDMYPNSSSCCFSRRSILSVNIDRGGSATTATLATAVFDLLGWTVSSACHRMASSQISRKDPDFFLKSRRRLESAKFSINTSLRSVSFSSGLVWWSWSARSTSFLAYSRTVMEGSHLVSYIDLALDVCITPLVTKCLLKNGCHLPHGVLLFQGSKFAV